MAAGGTCLTVCCTSVVGVDCGSDYASCCRVDCGSGRCLWSVFGEEGCKGCGGGAFWSDEVCWYGCYVSLCKAGEAASAEVLGY